MSLSSDEERKRVLETWYYFDWALKLCCFDEIDELGAHIMYPEKFRENLAAVVIVMSDQMPYYIKLRSGKQMYMASEIARSKKRLKSAEKELTEKSGGGSQAASTFARADDDEGNDGRNVAVGESHQNQDKFRITLDVEQAFLGWFGTETPQAQWGITSVIFPGAHFRASNITAGPQGQRFYTNDEKFYKDGQEVVRFAGTPVQPANLGSAILGFRDEHPEKWKEMLDLKIRFYQQPAGFEDAVISMWKVEEQHHPYLHPS